MINASMIMEKKGESSIPRHREWRRIAKRERRRRLRRKTAQERDNDDERLRATLERSAEYSNWIDEQDKLKKDREIVEQREHDEREKLWLEEEVRAQKEWRIHQERKSKLRQEQMFQDEIIRKEFEAKQEALRMKKEETKRLHDKEIKKHEDLQKEIDDYIDNGGKTPDSLRVICESQAGKELCPFFTKTGACRFGDICSRNHRRLSLSKVILVPGFYTHFSLEKNSAEYDTDVSLEFESTETRRHFREFYESVLPELESFGRIKTLKFCRNTEIHLRGNLYVEYYTEREAARALRKLKGRYYAGRQLNCEFVNLTSWRNAVCGMTKCPKGIRACNFLHTFRNPNDEYDIKSPPRWARKNGGIEGSSSRRSEQRSKSKWDDWERGSTDDSRNWRWSESPDPEMESRGKFKRARRDADEDSSDRRRHSRDERKRDDRETVSSRSSRHDEYNSQTRESTSRRSRKMKNSSREECTMRKREKKSKKRLNETNDDGKTDELNSNVERTKKSKSNRRKIENDRDSERRESRRRSRTIIEESDENFDTNSNNSRSSASREMVKLINDVETSEKEDRSIDERKKHVKSPTPVKRKSYANENEWNTTDSE